MEDKMGRACSMHGRHEMHVKFGLKNLKEIFPLKVLIMDWRIILKWA
jgi:hypothetical protein